jgi:hypothetical protein
MGFHRKDGYSASVEAYLVVQGVRYDVAKTSADEVVLAEPCELAPGCEAELVVIVDGHRNARAIVLDDGVSLGTHAARYSAAVPF